MVLSGGRRQQAGRRICHSLDLGEERGNAVLKFFRRFLRHQLKGLGSSLKPVSGSLACVFFPLFVIQILSFFGVYLEISGGWIAGCFKEVEIG